MGILDQPLETGPLASLTMRQIPHAHLNYLRNVVNPDEEPVFHALIQMEVKERGGLVRMPRQEALALYLVEQAEAAKNQRK